VLYERREEGLSTLRERAERSGVRLTLLLLLLLLFLLLLLVEEREGERGPRRSYIRGLSTNKASKLLTESKQRGINIVESR
jgi:hypothetical protein